MIESDEASLLTRLAKDAAHDVQQCFNAVIQCLFKARLFGLGLLIAYVSGESELRLSRSTHFWCRDFAIGSDNTYIMSTYVTQFGTCNRESL